jgi:hypothetical protein
MHRKDAKEKVMLIYDTAVKDTLKSVLTHLSHAPDIHTARKAVLTCLNNMNAGRNDDLDLTLSTENRP